MNRYRFHLSISRLLSQHRVKPDMRAFLAYGLVVALGAAAAVLIFTGTPFAHHPLGI